MEEKKKVIWTGVAFVLVLAAVIAIYYLATHKKAPEVQETPEIVKEKPLELPDKETVTEESVEPFDITLKESDEFLRNLIKDLSSDPRITEWMRSDQLIKKFVAAVDNIANGLSPRKQIDFFEPKADFMTVKKGEHLIIDTDSYKRYDPIAQVFDSIDIEKTVKLYQSSKPLIQEAYRELGYPDKDFDRTLNRAINELLNVPIVEQDIFLISKLKSFEMKDPGLEEMSPAQKHLFRMGPENIDIIQRKLREFQKEWGS
ncbi:MAG: DUF3014 domain-containing protein [Candidatus Aminicenantes bacterium]|nr:DUF3014 domain-containing protein [Candidatus Aminicenantes bacterium]